METKIIKNIGEYEEAVFIGMTMRQSVLGIAGVIIIAVAYFLTYQSNAISSEITSYIAIGFGLPCMLFAFFKPGGYKLEKYISIWITANFLDNKKRAFICENKFYKILWEKDALELKLEQKLNKKIRRKKDGIDIKKMDTKTK